MADTNLTYGLTIPNFIFSEGCQVTFKAPIAPIANVYLNLNIAGAVYRFNTLTHEMLSGGEWVANTSVTVTLSSQISTLTNEGNGTAFFKGGAGSIKDMYDFPLSIQTAAPTPVNANHIWVQSADTYGQIYMDEAMRVDYPDASLVFKTDNTANAYQWLQQTRKTTSGAKINLVDRKIQKDVAPWHYATAHSFAPTCVIDAWAKWPIVLSKQNGGVVDIETAQRWDGAAWQYLSQKGQYLLALGASTAAIWNRAGSVLTPHANQLVYSAENKHITSSKDGLYAAMSLGATVYIYRRTGDSFNVISSFAAANAIYQLSFSPDGVYLAIAATVKALIYKKQADGGFALLADLGTMGLPTYVTAICWSPTGDRLLSSDNYTRLSLYSRSVDTFNFIRRVDSMFNGMQGYDLEWPEGTTGVLHNGVDLVGVFDAPSLSFYKLFTASLSSANNRTVSSMSGRRLICKTSTTKLSMFSIDDAVSPLATCYTDSYIFSCCVSPDERYVFLICATSVTVVLIGTNSLTVVNSVPITSGSLLTLTVI